MKSLLDKIFFRSNNLDSISNKIKKLYLETPVKKIFDSINSYSSDSEIRYVGGCVRKIINGEIIDDIDLATNLEPKDVCKALSKNNINYYESGIEHGTITAIIDDYKFEITSLREDVFTDGRHAKVKYSKSWKVDASRRDFTINSIYSDVDGNLFDPFNGKNDLEKGHIRFIGDTSKRLEEDYLRIIRYIRFFLNYSKQSHNPEVIKKMKINIGGLARLSKERLLDELKKMIKIDVLDKLTKDKTSLGLILLIFPELKNINVFLNLSPYKRKILEKEDFIFFISLMIIDGADNVDYFFYKYNLSKKDQNRIEIIDNFFKKNINTKKFSEKNMNKIFYYEGRQAIIDILNFQIIKSKKIDGNLIKLNEIYKNKIIPKMPIKADVLISKYNMSEGRQLGLKLKMIEREWVENNFQISDRQVDNIINN